jgi:hypothetical protein
VIAAILSVLIVAALVLGFERDRGWVRIGSVDAVARARVLHVSNLGLFVVSATPLPVAVSADGPRGTPVSFCPGSQTFLDAAGDEFARRGPLIRGIASRGLDRVAVRIRNGYVDVNPGLVTATGVTSAPPPVADGMKRCPAPGASAPPFLSPAPLPSPSS